MTAICFSDRFTCACPSSVATRTGSSGLPSLPGTPGSPCQSARNRRARECQRVRRQAEGRSYPELTPNTGGTLPETPLSAEVGLLASTLNSQRDHVLGILDGLSEVDLRRPVLPTGWTSLGLVQHLALDVERFWFRRVMAGQPDEAEEPIENAWLVGSDVPAADVLGCYRREVERANAIIA